MHSIRGEKFNFHIRFMKYDYEKGEIVPKGLSIYSDISMKLFRPEFPMCLISMTDKNTGEEHEITFPITVEQQEKLESIEDEELKQLYMNKILQNSEVFKEKLKKIRDT